MKRLKWVLLMCAGIVLGICVVWAGARLASARQETRMTLCVHNLKLMGLCLEHYANEHGGAFPERISGLVPSYLPDVELLVCPQHRRDYAREQGRPYPLTLQSTPEEIDALSSYVLVPGLTAACAPDTVVIYEKADHHAGSGRSLLYRDGHGAWESPENWRGGPPNPNLPRAFETSAVK